MKYRLAIFDFDGTLADTFPWFLETFDTLADKHRYRRLDHANVDELRGLSARQMMARHQVPAWRLPMIAADMRRMIARDSHRIRPFAGAREMLADLSAAGVRLAIVTSNSEANVRAILGPETARLIDVYACGASVFGKKAKLKAVLKAAGVRPDQAISIGDEIRDAEASRELGIPFGAVAWGFTTREALANQIPAEVFDSFEEITQRLGAAPSAQGRG